jgi:hypothetical protein
MKYLIVVMLCVSITLWIAAIFKYIDDFMSFKKRVEGK